MKYNLKWTNIYSYESGYVAKVSNVNKCFVNTFEKDQAKKYPYMKAALNDIEKLKEFGEAENNIFEVEEV